MPRQHQASLMPDQTAEARGKEQPLVKVIRIGLRRRWRPANDVLNSTLRIVKRLQDGPQSLMMVKPRDRY